MMLLNLVYRYAPRGLPLHRQPLALLHLQLLHELLQPLHLHLPGSLSFQSLYLVSVIPQLGHLP